MSRVETLISLLLSTLYQVQRYKQCFRCTRVMSIPVVSQHLPTPHTPCSSASISQLCLILCLIQPQLVKIIICVKNIVLSGGIQLGYFTDFYRQDWEQVIIRKSDYRIQALTGRVTWFGKQQCRNRANIKREIGYEPSQERMSSLVE